MTAQTSKNVVVAVRCRPLNERERKRGAKCLVSMSGKQTTITMPESLRGAKTSEQNLNRTYTFDHSYWTAGAVDDAQYASQEVIFNDIGTSVLSNAFEGYNTCVFAYGQTGSGKSYTMMGGSSEPGLIPRVCEQLFVNIERELQTANPPTFHVEVSYLEIYNEHVRDLLNPHSSSNLRVREHPSLGPYVEDLTKAAVSSYAEILAHMTQGNKARTVAATNMNKVSSRSHAVFTVVLTRRTATMQDSREVTATRVSRISLVDLAGSERANSTMATGVRLKEGAKINQSLAALGKVISALAGTDRSSSNQRRRRTGSMTADGATEPQYVPYRDSVLTWLLKESLGGNSRTIMLATVSPADYSETLSTLRYADRAKRIVNVATVNEDASARLVRDLQKEVAELRKKLSLSHNNGVLQDQLQANEKLIDELNQTWEEKLRRTQAIQMERERVLAALGIAVDTDKTGQGVGIYAPKDIPHLVNLSEDPLMSECLVYNLRPGRTVVGTDDESGRNADIRLSATGGISPTHCYFDYSTDTGTVTITPCDECLVLVNGQRIEAPRRLKSGFRVIIGTSFVFRLNHPLQVRHDQQYKNIANTSSSGSKSPELISGDTTNIDGTTLELRPDISSLPYTDDVETASTSPLSDPPMVAGTNGSSISAADWYYAWREAHPQSAASESQWFAGQWEGHDAPDNDPLFLYDAWSEASDQDTTPTRSRRPSCLITQMYKPEAMPKRPASNLSFRSIAIPSSLRAEPIVASSSVSSLYDPKRPRGSSLSSAQFAWLNTTNVPQRQTASQCPSPNQSRPSHLAVPKSISLQCAMNVRDRRFYEQRLARLVVGRWRRHKLVKMGETMLRNATYLKEANIMSKELGQRVVYQFCILRGGARTHPESPLEPDALPAILSDWDAISINDAGTRNPRAAHTLCSNANYSNEGTVPEVVVKVLDIGHKCWYVWSLDHFRTQLERMRRLSTVRGSFRAHLVLDPFHESPSPRFSCIGTATSPIWPSDRSYSCRIEAPIVDYLTGLERGLVTGNIAVLPIRRSGKNASWNVIIHVKTLHGIIESEMSSVHCRLRIFRARGMLSAHNSDTVLVTPIMASNGVLSKEKSLVDLRRRRLSSTASISSNTSEAGSNSSPTERAETHSTRDIDHSNPVAGFGDGPINVNFRQQWHVDMLAADTCVAIDVFGAAQPSALRRAFQEDVQIEQALRSDNGSIESSGGSLTASKKLLIERLHEEELYVDSQHEIILWINIKELGLDGTWEAAPCTTTNNSTPTFVLRQGLQRRIEVVVGHNASKHLVITGVAAAHLGNPQLIDSKGIVINTHPPMCTSKSHNLQVTEIATSRDMPPRLDNRSFAKATMPWDSSIYGTRLLDTPTSDKSQRVRLQFSLDLEIAHGHNPIRLEVALFVRVHSRQSLAGRNNWMTSFLGDARSFIQGITNVPLTESGHIRSNNSETNQLPPLKTQVFHVFAVTLSPVPSGSTSTNDLWRLNTEKKYVRGEEALLPWRPRNINAISDFHKLENVESWRLTVARTREQLAALGPPPTKPPLSADEVAAVFADTATNLGDVDGSLYVTRIRQRVHEAVRKLREFRIVPTLGFELHQEPLERNIAGTPSLTDSGLQIMLPRRPVNVHEIAIQGIFSYNGKMNVLDTNSGTANTWVERWFVVERPYIFIFTDKSSRHLDDVVNISSARIEANPHVAQMLGQNTAIALYTNTNAYLLSPDAEEMQAWIEAIDEWYFLL